MTVRQLLAKRSLTAALLVLSLSVASSMPAQLTPPSGQLKRLQTHTDALQNPSTPSGYRINFNNVSVSEFLRFVSRISGQNFVFQESDVQFTVTVVSEDPVPADQVLSVMMQVLRVHGLSIAQQGDSVVIYKDASIAKIGGVNAADAALVTAVIHVDFMTPEKAASVITPLLSGQALVDSSPATNQVIITDIKGNVDSAKQLIAALDQPFESLDVLTFIPTNGSSVTLGPIAQKVLAPIAAAQGVPLTLVQQPSTNTIFLVVNKGLAQKAMQILQALDQPGSHTDLFSNPNINVDVLLYQPKFLKGAALIPLAQQILQPIAEMEQVPFKMTLQGSTGTIFITSTTAFNQRAQAVLISLDQHSDDLSLDIPLDQQPFEIATYTPTEARPESLAAVATQILTPIAQKEGVAFNIVVQASTQTLYISSTKPFIPRILELLKNLDQPSDDASLDTPIGQQPVEIASYVPTYAKPETLAAVATQILNPIAQKDGVTFHIVVQAATNTLYSSAPRSFNLRVLDLLKTLDQPGKWTTIAQTPTTIEVVSFTPQYNSPETLLPVAQKILQPLADSEKVPFIMVVQPTTKTLFIASTHDFDQRSLDLLKQLDMQPSSQDNGPSKAVTVEVASYQPQYLPADTLLHLAQKILGPIALSEGLPFSMTVQESTNVIFITSTGDFNARVVSVLAALDQQGEGSKDLSPSNIDTTAFWVYKLQYQTGDQIQIALHTMGGNMQATTGGNADLIAAINNSVWLMPTNSFLFTGTESAIARMKLLMPQLDVPSRQIYVEVLIIQTSLSNSLNFGVQIGGLIQNTKPGGGSFTLNGGNFTGITPPATGFPATFQDPATAGTTTAPTLPMVNGFNLGSIGDFIWHNGQIIGSLGELVQAVQNEADTKLIMNPKIIAVDNHQAKVFVGSNIPYSTANVQIQAANNSTGFNVDYRDIGIELSVTPTLGPGDIITLDINQEIDAIDQSQSQSIDTANGNFPTPTTTKLSTATRLHVPNGHFVVLSGMIQNSKDYSNSAVPCLGCIPYLGAGFSNQAQTYTKTNTIIFIHPRIMDTPRQQTDVSNYEGDEFCQNSKVDFCDINWKSNDPKKKFIKPCDTICDDLPTGTCKGPSQVAKPRGSTPPPCPPRERPKPPRRPGASSPQPPCSKPPKRPQ